MPPPRKLYNFYIDPELAAGLKVVKARDGVPPESLTSAARRAVNETDPRLALAQVMTLENILDRASAQAAFTMVRSTPVCCSPYSAPASREGAGGTSAWSGWPPVF